MFLFAYLSVSSYLPFVEIKTRTSHPDFNSTEGNIMMSANHVSGRVKAVISRVLKIDESEIADDANFIFDLGADSMQSLELIAGFEEEFDIEMDDDKALEVQNVADAVSFISDYL